MKKLIFYFSILVVTGFQAGCQTKVDSTSTAVASTAPGEISISPEALATAEWAKFDYKGILEQAKAGDSIALRKFLEFHALVDHQDALGHAKTCLELLPYVGDLKYASNAYNMSLKMRNIVRDRMNFAVAGIKDEQLKQYAKNFPKTFNALNNGVDPYNRRGNVDDKQKLNEQEMVRPDKGMGRG